MRERGRGKKREEREREKERESGREGRRERRKDRELGVDRCMHVCTCIAHSSVTYSCFSPFRACFCPFRAWWEFHEGCGGL